MDHVRYGILDRSPEQTTEERLVAQLISLAERGLVGVHYEAKRDRLTLINKLTDVSRAKLSVMDDLALIGFFGPERTEPECTVSAHKAHGVVWAAYRKTTQELQQTGFVERSSWARQIGAFCLGAPLMMLAVWRIADAAGEGGGFLVVLMVIAVLLAAGVALCIPRPWNLLPPGEAELAASNKQLQANQNNLSTLLATGGDPAGWLAQGAMLPSWLAIEPSEDAQQSVARITLKLRTAFEPKPERHYESHR